jgi:hypothetical protein
MERNAAQKVSFPRRGRGRRGRRGRRRERGDIYLRAIAIS